MSENRCGRGANTCASLGLNRGKLRCDLSSNCQCSVPAVVLLAAETGVNDDEECNENPLNGQSCESLGYVSGAPLRCTERCFSMAACSNCGNGMIDEGEACDLDQLNDMTCDTLVRSLARSCDGQCQYDL